MKKVWSGAWKGSKLPRKQRKYRANAPLHVKRKFLSVHLSKELRAKYSRRAVPVRSGDKVKVLIGSHRGHTGKVDRVDMKRAKIYVTGIAAIKKDGSKVAPPLEPSNLMITELSLGDKKREAMLTRALPQGK
ncbi:50S ribosomal protein L24 [Candidatus Woesearchaeota archaeon]|nr:50S ribosomal protein L24 [Candidatus Woesearchaeota archaeon]